MTFKLAGRALSTNKAASQAAILAASKEADVSIKKTISHMYFYDFEDHCWNNFRQWRCCMWPFGRAEISTNSNIVCKKMPKKGSIRPMDPRMRQCYTGWLEFKTLHKFTSIMTSLNRACRYGNQRVFDYILEEAPHLVSIKNKSGSTPLHLAAQFRNVKMIKVGLLYHLFWQKQPKFWLLWFNPFLRH